MGGESGRIALFTLGFRIQMGGSRSGDMGGNWNDGSLIPSIQRAHRNVGATPLPSCGGGTLRPHESAAD